MSFTREVKHVTGTIDGFEDNLEKVIKSLQWGEHLPRKAIVGPIAVTTCGDNIHYTTIVTSEDIEFNKGGD